MNVGLRRLLNGEIQMPNKIRILGIDYDINYVDCVCKEELRYGQIDVMNCEIRIDRTVSESVQRVTLIHEILHGICSAFSFEKLNDDEIAIQSISTALNIILSENGLEIRRKHK